MSNSKKVRGFEVVYGASPETKLPVRATEDSAGYDFYSPDNIYVTYGFTDVIWLTVKAYMRKGEYLRIENRSSIMAKKNAMLFCSGIIDADYYSNPNNDGNIGIRILNLGQPFVINKGERICQGIFTPYLTADGDNVTSTRSGGFGSTGK